MVQEEGKSNKDQTIGPVSHELDPWLKNRLLKQGLTLVRPALSAQIVSRISPLNIQLPLGQRTDRLTQHITNRPGLIRWTPENLALSRVIGIGDTGRNRPASGWSELQLLVSSHDTDRGATATPAISPLYRSPEAGTDIKNTRLSLSPQNMRPRTIAKTPPASTPPVTVVTGQPSGQARVVRGKIDEAATPPPNRPMTNVKTTDGKPISQSNDAVTPRAGTAPVVKPETQPLAPKTTGNSGITESSGEDKTSGKVMTTSSHSTELPVRRTPRQSVRMTRKSDQVSPVKTRSTKKNDREDSPRRNRTYVQKNVPISGHTKEAKVRPSISSQPEAVPTIDNKIESKLQQSSQPAVTPVVVDKIENRPQQTSPPAVTPVVVDKMENRPQQTSPATVAPVVVDKIENRPQQTSPPTVVPVINNKIENRPYSTFPTVIKNVIGTDNQSKPVADRPVVEIKSTERKDISRKSLSSSEPVPVVIKSRKNARKKSIKLDIPVSSIDHKPIGADNSTTKTSGTPVSSGIPESPKPASYSTSPEQKSNEMNDIPPVTGVRSDTQGIYAIHTSHSSSRNIVSQPLGLQSQLPSTSEQPPLRPKAHRVEEEKPSFQPPVVGTNPRVEVSDISTSPLQDLPDRLSTKTRMLDMSHQAANKENIPHREYIAPSDSSIQATPTVKSIPSKTDATVQRSVAPEAAPISTSRAESKSHGTSISSPGQSGQTEVSRQLVLDRMSPVSPHEQVEQVETNTSHEHTEHPLNQVTETRSASQPVSVPISESISRPKSGLASGISSSSVSMPIQRFVKSATPESETTHLENTIRIPGAGTPAALDLPVARIVRPRASEGGEHIESISRQASVSSQRPRVSPSSPIQVHSLPGFTSESTHVNRSPDDTQSEATSASASTTSSTAEPTTTQQNGQNTTTDLKALARDIYPFIRRMLIIEKERLPHVL